jgi:hypothetical protein
MHFQSIIKSINIVLKESFVLAQSSQICPQLKCSASVWCFRPSLRNSQCLAYEEFLRSRSSRWLISIIKNAMECLRVNLTWKILKEKEEEKSAGSTPAVDNPTKVASETFEVVS